MCTKVAQGCLEDVHLPGVTCPFLVSPTRRLASKVSSTPVCNKRFVILLSPRFAGRILQQLSVCHDPTYIPLGTRAWFGGCWRASLAIELACRLTAVEPGSTSDWRFDRRHHAYHVGEFVACSGYPGSLNSGVYEREPQYGTGDWNVQER